ncbi:AHH domain-containing protein [Archangium lipolyticum]|uniref:AHH domain-containing protein n=1 Tax=Archangium lipolyticum TaxID=2970465 RepID=UPI00214B6993|nr:AHH domain-containing protein [Archangium lipolyticum]
MHPSVVLVFCLLVVVPLSARAAPPEVEARLWGLEPVGVSEYRGGQGRGLKLSFKKLEPNPALELFSLEEARAVVEELGLPSARGVVMAGMAAEPPPPADLGRRVREAYEKLYGPAQVALPDALERAKWLRALALSPRYMGEGVKEAAEEMFSSRAVLLSVGMSMMLYMVAWAAPEPVFSKAFATAVTIGLLMTYTAVELYNVGLACLRLYREAEGARTQAQLEAVAERFGKAMGGVGLRVLVTLAGARLARALPEVPGGGLWGRLSPPRFSLAGGGGRGGLRVGEGARGQVSVADGTVVLMGVTANTTAAAVTSVVSAARTTGACDESKKSDNQAHHLCTNKNDSSDISGGPWTPRFEDFFAQAGMSLDDPANIVYLRDHKGPHPKEYHQEIFRRLKEALESCGSRAECRTRLVKVLDEIAGEVCTSGSKLNRFVTRKP